MLGIQYRPIRKSAIFTFALVTSASLATGGIGTYIASDEDIHYVPEYGTVLTLERMADNFAQLRDTLTYRPARLEGIPWIGQSEQCPNPALARKYIGIIGGGGETAQFNDRADRLYTGLDGYVRQSGSGICTDNLTLRAFRTEGDSLSKGYRKLAHEIEDRVVPWHLRAIQTGSLLASLVGMIGTAGTLMTGAAYGTKQMLNRWRRGY